MPEDLEGSWCCESDERKFNLNDTCGVVHWDNSFLRDKAADVRQQNEGIPPAVLEYILVPQPGQARACFDLQRENAKDRLQLDTASLGDESFAYQENGEPAFAQVAVILSGDVVISVDFQPWRQEFDAAALERYAQLALEKWELTLAESD